MEIYLDHAAATPLSPLAEEVFLHVSRKAFANPSSIHGAGQRAKAYLEQARERVAAVLGARREEIYFTSGGTESINWALRIIAHRGRETGKHHIISTQMEHPAVCKSLRELKREGFELTLLAPDEEGMVSCEQLREAIRSDTVAVTIMMVNNEIGTILPIAEMGRLCRQHGVLLHSDAVQAAGHLRINVDTQCIDLLSISGHKCYAPKGTGALYCSNAVPVVPLLLGGGQEREQRAGTQAVAAQCAMAAALFDYANHRQERERHAGMLIDALLTGLADIDGVQRNGGGVHLPGLVNLSFEGIERELLLITLDAMGVFVSAGAACASGASVDSPTLIAMGLSAQRRASALRFSVSYEQSEQEMHCAADIICQSVNTLRGFRQGM